MKSPLAWFRDMFARKGQDPAQITRYVMPFPVAGVSLGPDEILSLSVVWGCIDAISRAIGQCDWNIYQPGKNGRRDLLENDSLMYVLNTRPNPEMTAIGFREAMLFMGIPYGNAFAEIVRDGGGRIHSLWPMPSDRVTPRRDVNWNLVYEYREVDGEIKYLDQGRVLHLRGPGLYGLMGENLIARAAKSMAVAAAQERFSASFFGQGANPGGVLEYPGKLGDEQFKRLKEDFAEKRKGPENAHKPMILESGMKWAQVSTDPQKSQLVEARQFSVEEICRWFGVPPHKVQHLLHATFSNIEHQSIEFVRDAVVPWCRRLEQEADFKLIRQDRAPWRYTEIDTRPLLVGDAKSRAESYAILRQNGIANANELRALEGMNNCGSTGDVFLVQSNLTTIDLLIDPPEPPLAFPPGRGAKPAKTDDPAGDTDDPAATTVAREALTVIMSNTLGRYRRRLASRAADLKHGHTPAEVSTMLDAERVRLLPALLEELEASQPFALLAIGRPLTGEDMRRAIAMVDMGQEPVAAARGLLPASCPRPGASLPA